VSVGGHPNSGAGNSHNTIFRIPQQCAALELKSLFWGRLSLLGARPATALAINYWQDLNNRSCAYATVFLIGQRDLPESEKPKAARDVPDIILEKRELNRVNAVARAFQARVPLVFGS
jgi:hypothetical protein